MTTTTRPTYQPTQADWAELENLAARDTFVKSEKLYKKADAAYQLANRLYAAKRKRILASQERAPASKQQRYVDMLQQLSHDRLLSQILSLKYKR